jgi:hypothetical protein
MTYFSTANAKALRAKYYLTELHGIPRGLSSQ